jgi:hypothetical protein
MKRAYRAAQVSLVVTASVLVSIPGIVCAETPGEIPKPWTYEGSKKLQEQEQQQFQQQQQPSSQGSSGMAPRASL